MNRLSVIRETKLIIKFDETKMTKLVYAPKIRVFGVSFISPVCVEFVNDFIYRRMGL